MQGLASLPTFWAMPESRSPRAAIERAGGKRFSSFHQTLRQAQGELRRDFFAAAILFVLMTRLPCPSDGNGKPE